MKISLSASELDTLVINYVKGFGIDLSERSISTHFHEAGVDISIGQTDESPTETTPAKRTRRTKAEIEAARAADAEAGAEVEVEVEECATEALEEPVEQAPQGIVSLFG